MPLIQEHDQDFPAWCELRSFEIVRLAPGETSSISPAAEPKTVLIAGQGEAKTETASLEEGDILDLEGAPTTVVAGAAGATLIRLSGNWGEETGGLGLFGVHEVDSPTDVGDPVDYPKSTTFDAHFHDCDEYWIVFEGRGTAVSEGIARNVAPGDCIATGMGHHHDFPRASEPVSAVFFETTLQGAKRKGHLWNHTHGPTMPQPERI
jgi:mannose-6-phosphate isomerase-like protein (cupin superfamily)